MNRILVIRGGAIGDFVLTLPAMKLLRDNFPRAHLEILGYKHIAALAENRFYAQAVRSLESASLASFFVRDAELPADRRDYFRSFDLVVSYLFDPEQTFERNLNRCGVKQFLGCSPKFTEFEHAARQLARPLERLGFALTDAAARLYPSADDREFARTFLRNPASIVAVHPGSGSAAKNWPANNWRLIAEWLLDAGHATSLLVVGGEADGAQLQMLRATLPNAPLHFAEALPLPQLAALLEKSGLFLGQDSGISHMAAAVGTPCVLLFGPSDPAVWAPMNANVQVLPSPNERMEELEVEDVKETIAAKLSPRA